MWLAVLLLVASNLFVEIRDIIGLASHSRIATKIGLRPVQEVPFPAIIIDFGRPADPMGYLKYTRDIVEAKDIPNQGMFNKFA